MIERHLKWENKHTRGSQRDPAVEENIKLELDEHVICFRDSRLGGGTQIL